MLFLMKDGLRVRDVEVVEREHRLARELPDLTEIVSFGYEKTKFTETLKQMQKLISAKVKRSNIKSLRA